MQERIRDEELRLLRGNPAQVAIGSEDTLDRPKRPSGIVLTVF